jgi:hypothetical protein
MYLQRQLANEFDPRLRHSGAEILASGRVRILSGNQWKVEARVAGSRVYEVGLVREHDDIRVECSCPFFEDDGPCKHIWATILAADRRSYLLGSMSSGPVRMVDAMIDGVPAPHQDDEENPAARDFRLSSPKVVEIPRWRNLLGQVSHASGSRAMEEARRTEREIYYVVDVQATIYNQSLCLKIESRDRLQTGGWGKLKPLRVAKESLQYLADPLDREILSTVTGANQPYSYYQDSVPSVCYLKGALQEHLAPKIAATGRCRLQLFATELLDELQPLAWDGGEPWRFRLVVDKKDQKWVLRGVLKRGQEHLEVTEPSVLLESGLLIARGAMARFDGAESFPWIALLRKEKQIQAPLHHGEDLLAEIMQSPHLPEIEWPEELRVEEVTGLPRPHLKFIESKGWSKSVMRGHVSYDYDGIVVHYDGQRRGIYHAESKRYLRRNTEAERAALDKLAGLGLKRSQPYDAAEPHWEVSPKKLPAAVRELIQAGWRVEAEGKAFRRASGSRTEFTSGVDWFELRGAVDYDGVEVMLPELLKALDRGDQMVLLGDGSYGILPEDFLERYGLLGRLGRDQGDHLRFSPSQAGLLDVLLAARPEIEVDQIFARARQELRSFEGIAPAAQPPGFSGQLRGYQCEGLAWMLFLQRVGFGGCLADDMGVGKTPQVLALLETRRALREANGGAGPSLVVVPRSLVYNWRQEAARFTPRLRVLDHTGIAREKDPAQFAGYDLILTTYGTLRRDAAMLSEYRFDYVILDEAQAIKNAGSESAKAVRLLQASHRLALSGTPIENHLGELWSLFEFLNPGMMGISSPFRAAGGVLRNPDEPTRQLLAKALRPFILRRTKGQVVRELPEKLEQTVYCELDATQRKLYDELREHYRQSLLGRIESQGMAKSKMHILEALLRLRQAACHPGLLDKKRAAQPSAKFEALIPQLTEVLEEGHKALVFSQFTSLLAILRGLLDHAGISYEYLDGRTRDRQSCVERFQNETDCKLFLISLKAGGLGLNLTAAEYVFLLDPWWNPAVEAQAIDRAHRIGQSKPVFAYRLIARGTVEEKVLELQKSKRALADAIIGEDNRLVSNLKREDLELLLS